MLRMDGSGRAGQVPPLRANGDLRLSLNAGGCVSGAEGPGALRIIQRRGEAPVAQAPVGVNVGPVAFALLALRVEHRHVDDMRPELAALALTRRL